MRKLRQRIAVALASLYLLLSGVFLPALVAQEPSSIPASGTPASGASSSADSSAPAATPAEPRQPRAKTEEEFAEYQRFMRETRPDEQIQLIEDFLLHYPDSELLELAFQAATQAFRAKNDFSSLLLYGELTLGENEDNLMALLILASTIPERTSKNDPESEENLVQAEDYARRILDLLPRMPQPAGVTPSGWEQTKREAAATSHASLGMVNLIREDFFLAESEFKRSTDLASAPDPRTFYRLGLSYLYQRKYDQAIEALDRAAAVGGVRVTSPDGRPRDLVAEAKDFVLKSRDAAAAIP